MKMKKGKFKLILIRSIIAAVVLIFVLSEYSSISGFFSMGTCVENWRCGNWTGCSKDGIQFRACIDSSYCKTSISKPSEIQECVYVKPSCSDGIQNQGELGVDCGGPCLKCESSEITEKAIEIPELKTLSKTSAVLIILLLVLLLVIAIINKKYKFSKRKKLILHIIHLALIVIIFILLVYALFK